MLRSLWKHTTKYIKVGHWCIVDFNKQGEYIECFVHIFHDLIYTWLLHCAKLSTKGILSPFPINPLQQGLAGPQWSAIRTYREGGLLGSHEVPSLKYSWHLQCRLHQCIHLSTGPRSIKVIV